MSKKLLFDSDTNIHYYQIMLGYPIQIEDVELCEMHSSIIVNISGDEVGKAIELENGSIVYEIIIYATNSPYVWGKGGRLNDSSEI